MKNFFKKLSFVLAIAMVLTSLAPATASAAAKNYVKDSRTGKKVTAIYAYIGGSVATLTPYVNGKKASKVTIENSDPTKVDVSNKGVVTPLKNGTATLTFKSGKTTIAKVTVKARTRAKSLNIYDRAEYAAGKKEKLTEVTLKAGETKDLQVTMPISKAAKKAGGKKSSYFAYAKSSNEDVVTVTKNDDTQRNFTVKAVAAGSAKVTIVANQKTEKNVRADKYYVEASFNVTVEKEAEFSAKQTGVKKITVTGKDLTDKVADYTLKRGTVKVSVDKVELSEDKTKAVLVAPSAKYPAGTYVVTFGALTSDEFTVEDGKVDKFVTSEYLVLDGDYGTASTGSISYKVLNQFEEDITNTYSTLSVSCTLGTVAGNSADTANKKINVTNISTYYQVGTTGKVYLIATDGSGVQLEADIQIGSKRQPASVEVKGVHNGTKYVDLKANTNYAGQTLNLIVDVKDQYDEAYTAGLNDGVVTIITNPVLTGFGLEKSGDVYKPVAGTDYNYTLGGYPVAIEEGTYKAGTVTFTFVLKNAVAATKNFNATIDIAPAAKVAKIDLFALDTVYYGEVQPFGYTAYDQDGNEVTSYALLTDSNYGVNLPAAFSFSNDNYDDVAVLYLDGRLLGSAPADGQTGFYSGMVATADYGFTKMVTLNYNAAAHPQYILGVDADVVLGRVATGVSVALAKNDITIADQYGRKMDNTKNYPGYYVTATAIADGTVNTVVSGGASSIQLNSTDKIDIKYDGAFGADTYELTLYKGSEKVVGSSAKVTFRSADFTTLTKFEASCEETIHDGSTATGLTTNQTTTLAVVGYSADGVKFALTQGTHYNVESSLGNTATLNGGAVASELSGATPKVAEKTYDVKIAIKNSDGTIINKKVTVKTADPVVAKVSVPYGASFVKVATNAAAAATLGQKIAEQLIVVDQYGYKMNVDDYNAFQAGHLKSVYLYAPETATNKFVNNNTKDAQFVSAYSNCMAKLTFDNGEVFTVKVIFE